PRENSHVVGAFGVVGEVEALTLTFDIDAQADDDIDDLVENRRADARPHQRGADAPDLGDHLRAELVVGNLAGGVVHDPPPTAPGVDQDAGAKCTASPA